MKEKTYLISAVASKYNIHPQTLRLYEREGLLIPSRTEGNTRVYREKDLKKLEFILNLSREMGVNLAGREKQCQCPNRKTNINPWWALSPAYRIVQL